MTFCECKCVKCNAMFEFALKDGDKVKNIHCPNCKCPFMLITTMQDMGNRKLATAIAEAFHRITRIEGFLCEEMDQAKDVFHTDKQ